MSTIYERSVRVGSQLPRLEVRPACSGSRGHEAVDLARSVGLTLDPWQEHVLDVGCAETADGKWAAFEVAVVAPRQNGKDEIFVARQLAGAYLFDEELQLFSCHEFKTAAEGFRRLLAVVEGADDLRRLVRKVRTSHGEEGIELIGGQRMRFLARSTGSGRGFAGDTVYLNEAYQLGAENMAALLPTLSSRPNPQIWYGSSAPMATSVQLHAVRRRALTGG